MSDFAPKYRHAIGSDGALVDVTRLGREDRDRLKPFLCIGCEREVVARLPKDRTRHFAHRVSGTCARETYIHHLSKQVFLATYRRHVRDQLPFILRRDVTHTCTHFSDTLGIKCSRGEVVEHDLVQFFTVAEEEKEIRGFRADILLSAPSRPEVMLVEFAVSHECTPEKRASGLRIVEVSIDSEDDAISLSEGVLDTTLGAANCINFSDRVKQASLCSGRCDKDVWFFLVYPSRKGVLAQAPASQVAGDIMKRRVLHREILGTGELDPVMTYRQKVREAHFAGIAIRNCFICTYHGGDGFDDAVFCKLHRQSCGSNEAASCRSYKPLGTMVACLEADDRNAVYQEQRAVKRFVRRIVGL